MGMRLADMLVERQSNMEKHKAAILSRPEKKWFQTAGERQELKEASNELAKPTENGEEEPPEPTKTITKNKKKGTFDPDETAEQRRKRRAKEKHQRKKEEATKVVLEGNFRLTFSCVFLCCPLWPGCWK